ncbi:MAG: site-2 protease family protein [Gemmatimonadota bacterium]|nr:MAG: site-2 protease family protein [Gemmatimonadota bacterium]
MPNLVDGLVYYIVFLLSTTLHEAAHAWAAKRGGDLTAYHGGQVSLDPTPHIRREPFGMVVLPIITVLISGWPFGFASAPYDPRWAMRYPRRAAWMALAGPGSNLLLVVIAGLIINLGLLANLFHAPESVSFGHVTAANAAGFMDTIAFVLGVIFSLNLVLFILNMLPIPPLDGSGALPLLLSDELIPRYQQFIWSQPFLGWIGIFIAWQVFDRIFQPVFLVAVNLLYPGVSYQ